MVEMNGRVGNGAFLSHMDKAWASACRVILGGEVGPLSKYEDYLQSGVLPCRQAKSALSGKQVTISGDYSPCAKFISGDEISSYGQLAGKVKLDINAIKDIDSIVEALAGSIHYSGNDLLGNSGPAELSNRLVDSNFVYRSHDVVYSKYVACTYICKYGEYIFGCESVGKDTHFAIKTYEPFMASRLFECIHAYSSSDCLYSANVESCQECLFSFNLRGKRRAIGNLELPQEKFSALRAKLLEDIRSTLASKGSAPSLAEIIGGD